MCLAVPGRVTQVDEDASGMTMGTVDFGGITKRICLAWLPGVGVGEYVLVHVGFAISVVDEEEARLVFQYLKEMGELEELEDPSTGSGREGGTS